MNSKNQFNFNNKKYVFFNKCVKGINNSFKISIKNRNYTFYSVNNF